MVRKQRTVGNKIKNMSGALSHIIVNLEPYEGKALMAY